MRSGHYVFYRVNEHNLLEFRPSEGEERRMVFRVEDAAGVRILSRVRVGTMGVLDLLEPPVTLIPVE
jgi:hypothetical protein